MTDILRLDGATYINIAALFIDYTVAGAIECIASFDSLTTPPHSTLFGDNAAGLRRRTTEGDFRGVLRGGATNVDPYDPLLGEEVDIRFEWPGGTSSGTLTVEGNSAFFGGGSVISTVNFRIGDAASLSGTPMIGYLREVKVFDDTATLIHYWPIDEGTGSVITDTVGVRDGTVVGNVDWEVIGATPGFNDILDFTGLWLPGQSGTPPSFNPAAAGGKAPLIVQPPAIGVT